MDWNIKKADLRAATIAAFDELLASLSGERLYVLCLQTDDGGMSVGMCANTEEAYAQRHSAAASTREVSPSFAATLRWDSAEWKYELVGYSHFDAVNQDFIAIGMGKVAVDFDRYFNQLIDAMTDALAHLREERAQQLDGVTLFVTITDSDKTRAVEDASAKTLNPPEAAAALARR